MYAYNSVGYENKMAAGKKMAALVILFNLMVIIKAIAHNEAGEFFPEFSGASTELEVKVVNNAQRRNMAAEPGIIPTTTTAASKHLSPSNENFGHFSYNNYGQLTDKNVPQLPNKLFRQPLNKNSGQPSDTHFNYPQNTNFGQPPNKNSDQNPYGTIGDQFSGKSYLPSGMNFGQFIKKNIGQNFHANVARLPNKKLEELPPETSFLGQSPDTNFGQLNKNFGQRPDTKFDQFSNKNIGQASVANLDLVSKKNSVHVQNKNFGQQTYTNFGQFFDENTMQPYKNNMQPYKNNFGKLNPSRTNVGQKSSDFDNHSLKKNGIFLKKLKFPKKDPNPKSFSNANLKKSIPTLKTYFIGPKPSPTRRIDSNIVSMNTDRRKVPYTMDPTLVWHKTALGNFFFKDNTKIDPKDKAVSRQVIKLLITTPKSLFEFSFK